jgi:hypothetical protein
VERGMAAARSASTGTGDAAPGSVSIATP